MIPIPYREFDSIGVFDVQFTVTDANGCADSVTIPVLIDPSPEVVFTMPDGCVNQSISAQFTGLTQNPSTYLWDFGDNAFSILNNPSHNFSVYGEYTVSLSVTNAFNCTVVGQDQIDVFAVPVPSFDLGPYCKGTYVEMTNTSTIAQDSVTQTTWVINTTDTISGNPGFYLIPELGQQQIEVIATSNEGCSSSTFEFIEVEDSLNVSFSVGTGIAAVGEPFPFTNTTTGTNLALWNFGDQTFSSEFSPDHTYGEALTDSILQVYLIGLNASGCIDTAFQNVIVRPAELDLALETLFFQENGTFDFLGVKMNNVGTVRVKKVVFEVLSDKGPLVQETWTGNLLPTEDTIYVFQSQPSLQFSLEDEKEAFVCVRSIAYDWQNQAETLLQNNDRCLNLEGDGVILTTLAPNPASNEVGFQLLVTKSSVISAELIDMNGKRARLLIPSTTVEPGIVEFKADVRTIENGVYFLQFNCNGTTTTQRLVILQ
jgi:PKD repeat protein